MFICEACCEKEKLNVSGFKNPLATCEVCGKDRTPVLDIHWTEIPSLYKKWRRDKPSRKALCYLAGVLRSIADRIA